MLSIYITGIRFRRVFAKRTDTDWDMIVLWPSNASDDVFTLDLTGLHHPQMFTRKRR
jgi:hypothetical protein